MRSIIIGFSVFCSIFAIAAPNKPNKYDINFDLALEGKPFVSAKVKVVAGEKSTLVHEGENGKNIIDLVATEENGAIMMGFTISEIGKDGEKKILSNSTIVSMENKRAKIETLQNNSETKHISLSVLAKKAAM